MSDTMPVRILTPEQHDRYLAAAELADAVLERRLTRNRLRSVRRWGRTANIIALDTEYAAAGRRLNAAIQEWRRLNPTTEKADQ